MAKRDYETSPLADGLGLRDVILGLASDLQALRNGAITPQDANARAAVAKQMFNGVRLYLTAMKVMEGAAKTAGPDALSQDDAPDGAMRPQSGTP